MRDDHVEDGVAVFVAGGDVEEAQLVGPGRIIEGGLLHRIAGIAEGDEIHALDDPAILHVETRDDPEFQHLAF